MKALVLSGGASKGAYTAGVVRYLLRDKNMSFNIAVGTSTGALVSGPAVLGDYNYLTNTYCSVENADIFKNSVLGTLINIFKKVGPIGASLNPLRRLVREYYLGNSRKNLDRLIAAASAPDPEDRKEMVVSMVNVRTGQVRFLSSRQLAEHKISEETFLEAIIASCSEPVFTEPVQVFRNEAANPLYKEFSRDLYYDGGVKEFLPLEHAIGLGATEIWAVSTHPLEIEETAWGGTTSPDAVDLLKAAGWTLGALLDEVARGDRFRGFVYYRLAVAKAKFIARTRAMGLEQIRIDELSRMFDEVLSLERLLPTLYMISPQNPLPTSMEFDYDVMYGYLTDGSLAAERFFIEKTPLYADATLRPWELWGTRYEGVRV